MARTPRQRERSDSAEASAAKKPMTKAEAEKAMDRFKNLTRRLLNVSREQLMAEEQRHKSMRPKRKRKA
jgi:hypothetical protein